MNLGMIHDEPFSSYKVSGAIGSHALSDFAVSPLLFRRKHLLRTTEEEPQSAAFAFGSLFHASLLEGQAAVEERFAIRPDGLDRRTKEGRAAFSELEATGKKVISMDDIALVEKMRASALAKKTTRALLEHGKPEVTFRATYGNLTLQCRADWFDERLDEYQRPTIVDVKTIDSIAEFDRHFRAYAYYRQAGFYQLVVTEVLGLQGAWPRFLFIVCEKDEPNDCAIFQPCETTLDFARKECASLLERMQECVQADDWPGHPDSIQNISLPDWQLDKGPN